MIPSHPVPSEAPSPTDRWAALAKFERPLVGALAKLARQGFVVPPPDGFDLIRDFFLEEWNGVLERYNPRLGKWKAYVYGAFIHWARRRILKLQRWAKCLSHAADLEEIAAAPAAPSLDAEDAASSSLTAAAIAGVRAAMGALPAPEGDVLRGFLSASRPSERALADRFGLTRYRLRELLTDALGRVAALLGQRGRLSPSDWNVTVALWREGRSVRQAAAHLRLSAAEVQQTRRRIARVLREGLGLSQPVSPSPDDSPVSHSQWSEGSAMSDVLLLLRAALLAPGDAPLLEEVRRQAPAILERLRAADLPWDERLQAAAERDPVWVAQVYEVLGDTEQLPPEDQEMLDEMIRAGARDQAEVDEAFELACEAAGRERIDLLLDRVVQSHAFQTLNLPTMVLYAEEAVANLILRILSSNWEPQGAAVPAAAAKFARLLSAARKPGGQGNAVFIGCDAAMALRENRPIVPNEVLVEEIAKVVECPPAVATALLSWLVAAAPFRPYLFRGFDAEEIDSLVRLEVLREDTEMPLKECWGRSTRRPPGYRVDKAAAAPAKALAH